MPETESSPKQYGFRADALTPDFLTKIVEIYEDSVGKTSGSQQFLRQIDTKIAEEIKNELNHSGYHEGRIGSVFTYESKLEIKTARLSGLYYFNFKPNFNSNEKDKVKIKDADETNKKFKSKVTEYLISSGLGSEM